MRLVKHQFTARDEVMVDLMALVETLDPSFAPPVLPPAGDEAAVDGVPPVTVADPVLDEAPRDHLPGGN